MNPDKVIIMKINRLLPRPRSRNKSRKSRQRKQDKASVPITAVKEINQDRLGVDTTAPYLSYFSMTKFGLFKPFYHSDDAINH
jgi:hypothetical protein